MRKRFDEILPQGRGICLDVGAGSGNDKRRIEAYGYHYVSLDILHNPTLSVQWMRKHCHYL